MAIHFLKWIRGWRLDKLFAKRDSQDNILLVDAVTKGVTLAQKLKEWLNSPYATLLQAVIPGTWDTKTIELMNLALPVIIQDLLKVTTLGDVGELLQQYKFSDDFHKDKFYHDLAKTAANILSDGKLSFGDLTLAVQLIKDDLFPPAP